MIVTLKKRSRRESPEAGRHTGIERRVRSVKSGVKNLRSGDFGYIGRLRPFLSLHNLKLYLVALLQAFVAFGSD
jgi:hypothetical protein